MHISKIDVKNFRLLKNVNLSLEPDSTLIVGRNNSGKTSLTELLKRFLSDSNPKFFIEDFSSEAIDDFWEALQLYVDKKDDEVIRSKLPSIEASLHFTYEIGKDLKGLNQFIVDVEDEATETIAVVKYLLKSGTIKSLFEGAEHSSGADSKDKKIVFCKLLKDRIPKLFTTEVWACDPSDLENKKAMDMSQLRELIQTGFITAQRGLDDVTNKERDVLGKVLEKLFTSASSVAATEEEKKSAKNIDDFVKKIQTDIDINFAGQLESLLPALKIFGYPGLNDQQLRTETVLNVEALLGNHTKLRYTGKNGIGFPETYNGLGSRNLIFILFQLYEFFKAYCSLPVAPSFHIIFIEEPEAHLHPQMQEVFIRKLNEIAKAFSAQLKDGKTWPVQFVVTTHSTHMSNEASLESIRYFLNTNDEHPQTKIKDLRLGFSEEPLKKDKEFLHKFLALTSCDLFFCDKAILVEGSSERILMPEMINKMDAFIASEKEKLSSQYITTFEVGGAYSHNFFSFLDFLELKSLIITDLDSTKKTDATEKSKRITYPAHPFEGATNTSNSSLKKWFDKDTELTPALLMVKSDVDKVIKRKRMCYQVPEDKTLIPGRSFEDAFMLANPTKYELVGIDSEKALLAYDKAQENKKSEFAYNLALIDNDWLIPKYIKEGLTWLSVNDVKIPVPPVLPCAPIAKEK